MIKPFHWPLKGRLKVVGFASGSGKTLWSTLELQRKLERNHENSPFEVVGIFSSKKDSKALELAREYSLPSVSLDIKEYYKKLGKPLNDREARSEYDKEVLKLIKPFNGDLILLAGYVWATTNIILDNYMVVNVHPADLSIEKDGRRSYAGPNGVGAALSAGENYICSTSHLATKQLDCGPILMISPGISVDYALKIEEREFTRKYLKEVNKQSRKVGARTILEIALGNLGIDKGGRVYYKNVLVEKGIKIDNWDQNIPKFYRETEKLIKPKSVAIIGASTKDGIGKSIIKNIQALDFPGKIYAVNRRGEDVLNIKGFKSVLDIEASLDMAVITIPSKYVLAVAEECGKKGIKALVCISAGFKEIGGDGIENESKLIEIVNKYNMRLLGPNCMGVLNTHPDVKLNATILHNIPNEGNLAFVTQSGALGAGILDFAEELGLGFSVIASLGNQGDININDLLLLLAEDEKTEVILLYLESIAEPERFVNIGSEVAKKKSIIIVKAGRTLAGAVAATSHTGSLTGNDCIADALINKTGAIRVNTLEEAFHLSSALTKINKIRGNNVAVVTNAGGPGILTADALNQYDFELQLLPGEIRDKLKDNLLPEASTTNPIDLVAPAAPKHYRKAVKAVIESNSYDALLVVCVPPATINTGKVAEGIVDVLKESDIPVLTCFFGPTLGEPARRILIDAGIPTYEYPEQLATVLSYMRIKEGDRVDTFALEKEISKQVRDEVQEIIWRHDENSYLSLEACERILRAYGLDPAASRFITYTDEVNNLALKYPVVAKIDHPEVIHKSDAGGVVLNINNEDELKKVVQELMDKFPGAKGVQVQEQIKEGIELILGSSFDSNLGHSIIIGLGGTMVEILKDISFGHVPLNLSIAEDMIKNLKSYPILKGYRGKEGVNIEKLKEELLKLNKLLLDFPEIKELDLNPVIYSKEHNRLIIADWRIKI